MLAGSLQTRRTGKHQFLFGEVSGTGNRSLRDAPVVFAIREYQLMTIIVMKMRRRSRPLKSVAGSRLNLPRPV
jgi:hypothetical protein